MDLRETEKKQGIKLQIKQKQTRSPKKRRSLRWLVKREKELAAAEKWQKKNTAHSDPARTNSERPRRRALNTQLVYRKYNI